jgi:UDP:flavonoid glycosyltransferase YjiC (YdhE family)
MDQFVWDRIVSDLGLGPKGIKISRLGNNKLEAKVIDLFSNTSYKERSKKIGSQLCKEDFREELYKAIVG